MQTFKIFLLILIFILTGLSFSGFNTKNLGDVFIRAGGSLLAVASFTLLNYADYSPKEKTTNPSVYKKYIDDLFGN